MEIQVSRSHGGIHIQQQSGCVKERRKYRTLALSCPSLCDWASGSSTSLGTVARIGFGEMNHAEPTTALEPYQTMIVLVQAVLSTTPSFLRKWVLLWP